MFDILLGVLVVCGLTALTGYFVAQEFGYMAVDRSRLTARASAGDGGAARALRITSRTSFLLSGAQLGITVTGLLVGYVAEPLIGESLGTLLGGVGVPFAVGMAVGTAVALLYSTVVQMVFGELFPKNLAIARPEPVARRLARSTSAYLAAFGWLIRLFDRASEALLRLLRIEPVHDVEHSATARDLEHIVAESGASGDLPAELSVLLDRVLDFHLRTAEHAMVPRPLVSTVNADQPVRDAMALMATGPSRLPVLGRDADDVRGIVSLRDVLALPDQDLATSTVGQLARPAVLVPASLPLGAVLDRLRADHGELACVVDEYGGLAGVLTAEDLAEELVGEITDEHDPAGLTEPRRVEDDDQGGGWLVDGTLHVDEAERTLGHDLPRGDYQTVAGLVIARLGRLPEAGDAVTVTLPAPPDTRQPGHRLTLEVHQVRRRVPAAVWLRLTEHNTENNTENNTGNGGTDR